MSPRRTHSRQPDGRQPAPNHACECELVDHHPGDCWCGGCDGLFPARLHGRRVYMGSHDATLAVWDEALRALVAREAQS